MQMGNRSIPSKLKTNNNATGKTSNGQKQLIISYAIILRTLFSAIVFLIIIIIIVNNKKPSCLNLLHLPVKDQSHASNDYLDK